MTALELLDELDRLRISIWIAPDRDSRGRGLEWRGARGAMTSALRAEVVTLRDELIALLSFFPSRPCATCGGEAWRIAAIEIDLFECRGCGSLVMVAGLGDYCDKPSTEDGPG
jgi:hypothetical protein